jgi:hypothetical protein
VEVRSGGGAAGSKGGKLAEALGDVSFQFRLVILDDKQVIAFSIFDRLTDFPLAEDRVTGNDRSLQWQGPEERKRGGVSACRSR